MLLTIVLALSICCVVAVCWIRRYRMLKATANLHRLSGQLPLLGSAHRIVGDTERLWEFIKDLSDEINDNGGVGTTWLGPTVFFVAVTNPELAFAVANTCFEKPIYYVWVQRWLGQGLLTGNVDVWKYHRKLLNPAFNQSVLNSFLQIFNQQSRRLVLNLSKHVGGEEFNHRPSIAENSLETICQTAMGLPENKVSIVDNNYMKALDNILEIYFRRLRSVWKHPQIIYNFTSMKRKEESCMKILREVSNSILKKSKESIMNGVNMNQEQTKKLGTRFKPFLELLLEISESGQLSDDEIRDEVDTIISTGYETTANTVVLILIMLGSYADVQEKVYKELQEVFGDTNRGVTKEDLPKLVYLDAVVKECLRFHPMVPLVARTTEKDVVIGEVTFPAGSNVLIPIWGINRHPVWGTNRNEFVPDRWLSPDTLPSNMNAFATFSLGKRSCIGKTYAIMSVKVTIAHILRNYVVRADDTKLKFNYDFVLRAVVGHQITLRPR